ncbi:MAG: tungstate ABC transporter ATP-binding protein WtpC [Methanocellales archaeon]|nr:tungstate ABC transporter ATP-binding protein WtpC [Methanocellales archaeon]MDD3421723.1 tungstate ABC transporter ATP-binding protein WtpC [Methanocellales archaeon]MDD4898930.1 tungstate ABC transporter ATP-binding protein WtpC [Methanocellales archaeon]MDD5447420.1 tungstate ABC transporter ATP-binding protein WtpC [Methanocellales archaeon]
MIEIRDLCKDWKEFSLKGITLDVKKGEYFVILGPTGAGKTLLLETVAGFHTPDKGDVWIEGLDVTLIPPEKRKIGFIYQDYALFPHLTVEQNIIFGLKLEKSSKSNTNRARLQDIMDWLEISHLAHRYPDTLSGGEQQKVAIARAIAIEPQILLLDEPLSALDSRTRDYLRGELKRIKKEFDITMVHVTHDQTEAMFLADRIGVMMDGEIAQVGTSKEIFNEPINERVAEFVGVENIIEGVVESKEDGITIVSIKGHRIEAVSDHAVSDRVYVCLRPEDVTLAFSKKKSSARNSFKGTITQILPSGALTRVSVDCGFPIIALVTKRSLEDLGFMKGDEVYAKFKATSVHLACG